MANLENSHKWTFTGSTGSGKALNIRGYAQAVTFGVEASSGCTATVQVLHRMGSSAGPYSVMNSTALSTGSFVTQQFLGPLEWVKPRLTDLTAGSTNVVTVYLIGN
jgi:hypothetical protein